MYIEQLYTDCLAEAAYYIESNGEVAIIDPMREINPYLNLAKGRNATIKYVFETHFHADFISGHIDLSRKTGAEIIYGPGAKAEYTITAAEDNQIFMLGDIQIKVLHTPGHTMESSCFLVLDEQNIEHAVFTGDTLFVGDVGRPDLAVKSDLSREDLAGHLFRSIHEKLLNLADEVIMYPGHGAGSQCGKSLGIERVSTIGDQKRLNYSLQVDNEADFVKVVTNGLTNPPQYFPKNAVINKNGYEAIDTILERANHSLEPNEFQKSISQDNVVIIDSRSQAQFSAGFIPNSLNIGLNGTFAVWLGTLVEELDTPILVVAEEGKEEETILRMARVGYENVKGYLKGGYEAWRNSNLKSSNVNNICPVDFKRSMDGKAILDVRNEAEYEDGHLENAKNIPLPILQSQLSVLDKSMSYHIYCKSGYRSMIAASILQKNGFENIVNIKKGYDGIKDATITCCCAKAFES